MLPSASSPAARAVRIEALEGRVLLHALSNGSEVELAVKVNFQPAGASTPAGYLVDAGFVFGDRGNGQSYGWDADNRAAARDRNSTASPDQRYDTLTHTQLYGVRNWEIAVPSGDYLVRIVAGDPSATNSVYGFDAEGVSVVGGRPTSSTRWFERTKVITVEDGRLTVSNGAGASNNKIAFIEVTSIHDAQPPASSLASWQPLAPSPVARFESGSAAIDGKLYVFGGYDKNIFAMTRSDVYDPVADRWSRVADMPEAITHAGVAVDGSDVFFAGGFVGERSNVITSNVWRYDARDDAWTALTPLPEARAGGGLVRIGRNLHYFGGTSELSAHDFGDHWVLGLDAPAGTAGPAWQPLAPLPKPRNHAGYAAVNGKVYCIGGQLLKDERLGNVADVHAYDPATDRWSAVASLPMPLSHFHTATVVVNGRIMIAGGNTNDASFPKTVSNVFSYDPPSNTWVSLPSLPDIRQAAVAQLIGERLYVTTGTPRGINPQLTTWSRAIVNTWDAEAAMPVALGETAGGVIGNKLYLVGEGSDATLAYDISRSVWLSVTALARRPFPGHHHAAEIVGGKLYLFGGLGAASEGKVQIYDPVADVWTLGASMPFATGSASSATIGGRVYVAGGIVGGVTTSRAARYHPPTNSWAELPPMPRGRNHAASATDGKRLYIFGGRGAGSGDSNTVANGFDTLQIFNPTTNQWWSSVVAGSTLRPLPQARGGMGRATYINGELYIFGGETLTGAGATAAGVYSRVDVYNPALNIWRLAAPMPTARHGIYPVAFANRVYIAGGGVRAGASASTVLEILNLP